jgi:hypothetical protein
VEHRFAREHPPELIDRHGDGLSYRHMANLSSGRDTPSRHALELFARVLELPVSHFADYRLVELRRRLDDRGVGFATAYRTYRPSTAAGRCAPPDRGTRLDFRSRGLSGASLVNARARVRQDTGPY